MKVNHITTNNCVLIGNRLYTLPEMTLVAELKLKNFMHFEFQYITENDKKVYRSLKVYKKKPVKFERMGNELYNYDGLYICQHCNRPIVKVYDNSILNFALFVKCRCGIIYDRRRKRREEV